jgi:hypothetical protein
MEGFEDFPVLRYNVVGISFLKLEANTVELLSIVIGENKSILHLKCNGDQKDYRGNCLNVVCLKDVSVRKPFFRKTIVRSTLVRIDVSSISN